MSGVAERRRPALAALACALFAGEAIAAGAAASTSPEGHARGERAALELVERLRERERVVAERESSGAQALAEVESRMAELEALRVAIDARLDRLDALEAEWMERLVEIYARMPAERAAAVIDGLDPELAAALLGRIRAPKAAEILAALPVERAVRLSEAIARAPQFPAAAREASADEKPAPVRWR
ncbi:hypothetical protein MYXO_02395 [Myxococcaceae bacterium]|nr:hypothetical protein MYXO_02395 [Myxococcaceae bacterium]